MKTLKIGQEITLVSKGIMHSCYSSQTWIDELQQGSTSFLKVTKVGTKYVYGIHFWIEDGERKEAYYESKHNLDEYLVFNGVRKEFDEQHKQFRQEIAEYEKLREETKREFERELSKQLSAKMDEWMKNHPRPIQRVPKNEE